MTEYGRIHTDGSRFGGQPLIANRKAHTMILEVLAEWGIKPRSATAQQLHVATTEALCRSIKTSETLRQPTQSDALLDAEGVKIYWYRQGKDDGVEHERAKIVAWLMREEDDYPSGKYSGFAAIIREEIEAGEHLK